jgi:hypothetical protein
LGGVRTWQAAGEGAINILDCYNPDITGTSSAWARSELRNGISAFEKNEILA